MQTHNDYNHPIIHAFTTLHNTAQQMGARGKYPYFLVFACLMGIIIDVCWLKIGGNLIVMFFAFLKHPTVYLKDVRAVY